MDIDKEVSAIKNVVARKIRVLEIEREKIASQIYRLNKMIEGMDDATALKRIRRVSHEKICAVCHEKFKTGTESAEICKKKECRAAQSKKTRERGTTLIAGDGLKTKAS